MRFRGAARTLLETPPTATITQAIDPYLEQTTFLLHFDNNITNFGKFGQVPSAQWVSQGIAATGSQAYQTLGTLTYSSSIYKFGAFSGSFAGGNGTTTGNVLAVGNFFALPMATGDFTMEMWVYPTQNATEMLICGQRTNSSSTTGFYLSIAAAGAGINFWFNNVLLLNPTNTVPINQWTSIAITRKGSTWCAFINGVCVQTTTNNTVSLAIPQEQDFIGGDNRAVVTKTIYQGYMDEFRFTTACRYTTNYRVQTAAFPNYVQAPNLTAPSDDHWGNVALLAHFEGPNANSTAAIVDSGPYNYTITRSTSGSAGTAPLEFVSSTSEGGGARWGTTSLALNTGYSPTFYGNFALPSSQTPLNLGTGDFTVEFWMGRNGQPVATTSYLFSCGSSSLECATATGTNSGQNLLITYNGSTILTSLVAIMDDAWHAIALVRLSGVLQLYIDGNFQGQIAFTSSVDFGGSAWGRRSAGATTTVMCSLIDELRITNGFGRYYTNYLPQRNAFQNTGVTGSFISNTIGNASVIAPANTGNASITIYGAGGNGGPYSGGQPGGGGGQGGVATLNTTVSAGTTYYYNLQALGSPSYWGNSQVFGCNSGVTGTAGVGGAGGGVYGSYSSGAAGQSGFAGNAIVQAGGIGGGPGGGGGQGPIPPNYTTDNLYGGNGTVGCGGGGASNWDSNPVAGLGGPPQIAIVWSN